MIVINCFSKGKRMLRQSLILPGYKTGYNCGNYQDFSPPVGFSACLRPPQATMLLCGNTHVNFDTPFSFLESHSV
jgi:hypothetical protein